MTPNASMPRARIGNFSGTPELHVDHRQAAIGAWPFHVGRFDELAPEAGDGSIVAGETPPDDNRVVIQAQGNRRGKRATNR